LGAFSKLRHRDRRNPANTKKATKFMAENTTATPVRIDAGYSNNDLSSDGSPISRYGTMISTAIGANMVKISAGATPILSYNFTDSTIEAKSIAITASDIKNGN
jgi:hypothetical protein